jgi:hypothetical protein
MGVINEMLAAGMRPFEWTEGELLYTTSLELAAGLIQSKLYELHHREGYNSGVVAYALKEVAQRDCSAGPPNIL